MGFFEAILSAFLAADLVVWWLSARAFGRTAHRGLRLALHGFFVFQILLLATIACYRSSYVDLALIPVSVFSVFYLWHLLVAPLALVTGLIGLLGEGLNGVFRFLKPKPVVPCTPQTGLSRREFLGTLAAFAPPVLTCSLSALAAGQLNHFRIRRLSVVLPTLPASLDGMTIVHLSDLHVGQFTQGPILKAIVAAINDLHPDLTVFTGDLINSTLDALPQGIETLRAIRSPLVLCEGNHDVGFDRRGFERGVKASGLCLLLNEAVTLRVRGVPVQVLGVRWDGPQNWQNRGDEREMAASVEAVLALRDPAAFPILLAHHPHAWDYCGDIALTLSGHTHGGQLMIDEEHGFGPVMFRYWSGLYTRPAGPGHPAQALVVSNGVGNWFPLRTGAPSEITYLTLKKSPVNPPEQLATALALRHPIA